MATNATIATTTTPMTSDTAPSVRSARWSGQGSLRRLSNRYLLDRDPLRRDDLAGVFRVDDPRDEFCGRALGATLRHLVKPSHTRVLAGNGIRLVAGDAVQGDGVDAALVGLVVRQEADPAWVIFDLL